LYSSRRWLVSVPRCVRVKRPFLCLIIAAILPLGLNACSQPAAQSTRADGGRAVPSVVVKRGDFRHSLRLSGSVGAIQSYNVQAPRLSGQMASSMVLTKIVRNGVQVRAGDVLVELDRQNQLKSILDKQAECDTLVQQIRKKQADQAASRAADETELKGAEVDVQTSRVEMRKNEVIPGYQAEINKVNLAEADAKLKQLKDTFSLKREAQVAELRILEIQRDRAKMAVDYAQGNIENMTVKSPMAGLAVLTPVYKGSRMVDPQEGDEVRSGSAIMVVVNPSEMQITARVNQVDISKVYVGQSADVRLDAYPDLIFTGKVESISAIGTPSTYLKRIRYFSVTISIQGSNPKLLPDLTAAVDLQLESAKDALILPREAVVFRNGEAMVAALESGKVKPQVVMLGPVSECELVIESGIMEGMTVLLNPEIPAVAGKRMAGQR
jgi:HlyD family secretion protein